MDPRTESRVLGLISVALALFGIFAPYQWREMPSIVTTSALGLAAIFAVLAIWLILPERFKKRDGKVGVLGPWVLIFGGPLLGALWLYMQQVNQSPVQATASPQPDIAFSLYLNCRTATIPTASLPNTVLRILEITTSFGDGMIAEHTIPAGHQKLLWPHDYLNAIVFRCELTNYGEKTVFDVELLLHLTVREVVRDTKEPRRISEGVTKPSKDYIFKIAKIDSGADRSTVFYIFNKSPNFARVIPNETATLQQLGTVSRKTVPVMYSKKPVDIMSFVPFPPMK